MTNCRNCVKATIETELPRQGYRAEFSEVATRGILHNISIGRTPLVKCSDHK